MTSLAIQPDTIRAVLATQEGERTMAEWLQHSGALTPAAHRVGTLVRGLEASICRDTSEALADVLDLNLVDLLVDGWRAEGALLRAARTTAADPHTTEHVKLVTQKITWSANPSVEVEVNGVHIETIHFLLHVLFDITALATQIRQGRIVALEIGACEVTASMEVNGAVLKPRQPLHLDAAIQLRPGSGIVLAEPAVTEAQTTAELIGRHAVETEPGAQGELHAPATPQSRDAFRP